MVAGLRLHRHLRISKNLLPRSPSHTIHLTLFPGRRAPPPQVLQHNSHLLRFPLPCQYYLLLRRGQRPRRSSGLRPNRRRGILDNCQQYDRLHRWCGFQLQRRFLGQGDEDEGLSG
ncbi:hypothetical protein KSP40_PGU017658 [Platanthera guangdongensis]|uniref:Uncharacterized protein n=1 Tax=Platanthera guangdongensis TaxID=2320717 RepID=A0ABR2MAR5_9ASPA